MEFFSKLKVLWDKKGTIYNIWKSHSGTIQKLIAIRIILYHTDVHLKKLFHIGIPFASKFGKAGSIFNLNDPVGIRILDSLTKRLIPLNIVFEPQHPKKINFLLPNIDPDIIFGGYISIFNLMLRLQHLGYLTRVIVLEPTYFSKDKLLEDLNKKSIAYKCIDHAEIVLLLNRKDEIKVSKDDIYIAYDWISAELANNAAKQTNGKPFIYYIQEYEPIFHPLNSIHALCASTYFLNHYAIFNSYLLAKYFKENKIGIYSNDVEHGDKYSAFFSHAISDIKRPSIKELRNRKKKKLLVYARPESHAARNLFEISIMAIRLAIQRKYFDEFWEFHGIGSLSTKCDINICENREFKLLKRVGYDEYVNLIKEYDIGMSLMYAPHPSVPPLEMASAGLITITTTFGNRTSEDMAKISNNIIAVNPDMESLSKALKIGIKRSANFEERIKNAKFEWPRTWTDSFNMDFIKKINTFIE